MRICRTSLDNFVVMEMSGQVIIPDDYEMIDHREPVTVWSKIKKQLGSFLKIGR